MINKILTVAIPNFNGGINLERAIRSCRFLKIEKAWEILIVDNGSTDDSLKKAEIALEETGVSYRIVRNPSNIGRVQNWNRCIDLSEGRYIHFLFSNETYAKDNDLGALLDEMDEGGFELARFNRTLVGHSVSNSSKRDALCLMEYVKNSVVETGTLPFGPIQTFILSKNFIGNERFDPSDQIIADHELFLRLARTHPNAKILRGFSQNVIFDENAKGRVHSSLSYGDMLPREWRLSMDNREYLKLEGEKISEKYLARIFGIALIHNATFGTLFKNYRNSDLKGFVLTISKEMGWSPIHTALVCVKCLFDRHNWRNVVRYVSSGFNPR